MGCNQRIIFLYLEIVFLCYYVLNPVESQIISDFSCDLLLKCVPSTLYLLETVIIFENIMPEYMCAYISKLYFLIKIT